LDEVIVRDPAPPATGADPEPPCGFSPIGRDGEAGR